MAIKNVKIGAYNSEAFNDAVAYALETNGAIKVGPITSDTITAAAVVSEGAVVAAGDVSGTSFLVDSTQIVGARATTVAHAEVASGANPTKAEYDALVASFNDLLDKLETHGLIAAPA